MRMRLMFSAGFGEGCVGVLFLSLFDSLFINGFERRATKGFPDAIAKQVGGRIGFVAVGVGR